MIYISGPMSGYPELNFPAFHNTAKRLREQGHIVISPAEIEQPVQTWEACMRKDIKQMLDCDRVAVMSGWQESKGARIEVNLAVSIGMEIIDAETLEPVEVR